MISPPCRSTWNGSRAPEFATRPPTTVVADAYRYTSVAVDPGFRKVTYSLASAPAGMVVDARTGVVAWAPSIDQLGVQRVILQARNDRGAVASQDFAIDVTPPKCADHHVAAPLAAFVGEAYRYDVAAKTRSTRPSRTCWWLDRSVPRSMPILVESPGRRLPHNLECNHSPSMYSMWRARSLARSSRRKSCAAGFDSVPNHRSAVHRGGEHAVSRTYRG